MTNPDNVGGLPELPELPEPRLRPYKQLDTVYYNAGQMKEYARAYGELCRAAPAGSGEVTDEMVEAGWQSFVRAGVDKRTQNAYVSKTDLRAALEAALSHAAGQDCMLGVGDGSGQLFVHGNYESIKACQALILRGEAAGQEVERSRLLCWAFDNLNDMPVSDEWAAEWCRQTEPFVLAGHPAVASSEGEEQRQPIAYGNVTAWTSPGHGGGMTHYGIELGNDYEKPCPAAALVGKRFALIPTEQKP